MGNLLANCYKGEAILEKDEEPKPVFSWLVRLDPGGAGTFLMEHMLTFRNFSNSPPTAPTPSKNERTKSTMILFEIFPEDPTSSFF